MKFISPLFFFLFVLSPLGHSATKQEACKSLEFKSATYERAQRNGGRLYSIDPVSRRRRMTKTYRGCKMDLDWIKNIRGFLCENAEDNSPEQSLGIPKHLMFYIAGAGDFNASAIVKDIAPINLTGDEGNDLVGGNWSGSFLRKALSKKFKEDSQIFYYAGSGFKSNKGGPSALQCLEDLNLYFGALEQILPDVKLPKIILAGYSNGAALAVEYQEELGSQGMEIDLVFAIDPVVQTHKFLFESAQSPIGQRHPLTKRLVTYRQTRDYGSLYPLKLRGRQVVGADTNQELSCENTTSLNGQSPMNCDGFGNHISILKTNELLNAFKEELETLQD